jgi:hypothetical protein
MQNILSFDIQMADGIGSRAITPCIDGVPLTELIASFEHERGYSDPAGGYGGLSHDFFDFGPADQYFQGHGPFFPNDPGEIWVLGCACGEAGCWPLLCSVEMAGTHVRWESFRQPFRPARDYSGFGPFIFAKEKYETAVRSTPFVTKEHK